MVQDNKHRSLLSFIAKLLDVPAGYSKDDLIMFRSIATRQFPTLVRLIDEYISLAESSDSPVLPPNLKPRRTGKSSSDSKQMHLFDLLREKTLFPLNSDLVEFAGRILPEMRSYRYDKMSKADIAARMVEYLETLPPDTKDELEHSMRSAVMRSPTRDSERKSFFNTWEKIIKGTQY